MDIKLMPEKYKRREETPAGVKPSVINFLNKLASKSGLWLFLTFTLLILIIFAFFVLQDYKNNLIGEKENLEERIGELNNQRDLELEANFIELKKGIEDFKKVLENRPYPSKIFEMLEEITLPQVQFTDLNADLLQAKLVLKTEAENYSALAEQILVFEQDSRIKKIEFAKIDLGPSGRVGSNLEIELNLDFFTSPLKYQ
jgi:hypothetical protein